MDEKMMNFNIMTEQINTRDSILDNLNVAVYVSDLATNEILYANRAMCLKHDSLDLTGRVCWEAIDNNTKRCESCPIPYLLKHPGKNYQREVYNGWHLKIYDSIIPWENGKLAHLRYVVDIAGFAKWE